MGRTVYVASPLGFSPETRYYLARVKERLVALGFDPFDPWAQDNAAAAIQAALAVERYMDRVAAFAAIAAEIGTINERGIRDSDMLFAVLDGMEVDSGTASEVGFAAALGKRCFGLRTDTRDCGDFTGIPVNLQVHHFITCSGGKLFRSMDEIEIP